MPPILYLIDGHALAYRAFFALTAGAGTDRLQTRSGEPTAGVLGFTNVIFRMLDQDKPEYMAVAFDAGHSFRDEIYPEYKATRAKMPDDLRSQMERIRQLVDAFGFPRLELDGFEADDVIGSITRYAVSQGYGVKIITGDRDLLQLVDDRVIVRLAGGKLSDARDFTPEIVKEYMGVRPDQIVDYKALVGDSSDNIPGVPGIGEKTAVSLLSNFDTLDGIYAHIDELKGAVKTKLESGRDSALMSRELARIRTDLKVILNLEKARVDQINYPKLESLFRELEFRSLMERLQKMAGLPLSSIESSPLQTRQLPSNLPVQPLPEPLSTGQMSLFTEPVARIGQLPDYKIDVEIINSLSKLEGLMRLIDQAGIVALDTETTSTDPMRAELVGISFAIEEGKGYYLPVGHHTSDAQLNLIQVAETLQPILKKSSLAKVGHNLKYDVLVLKRHGLSVESLTFDTLLAEWLIDPSSRNLGLKNMADAYLGVSMTHIEELIGKGKSQISMADVPIDQVAAYAAADAEVVIRLIPKLKQQLSIRNAEKLFNELEMPLIAVLMGMEETGIAVNKEFFKAMSAELSQRLFEIERETYRRVGKTFNLNSTQQLSVVLFETLGLEPPDRRKKTASGHFSTSADVLEELRGKHPVVDLILEYRELAKLKSTYVDALPLEINPLTNRVHTSFNQTGSVTGRLASSDPNLQNIPTRTDLGRKVRQGFIASEGCLLLSVDYSQIELRIVAHMAKDEAMLSAFRAGLDIHSATAAAIQGVPLEAVTKEMRRNAKAINFGLIYGMSPFGLSRSTGLTLAEAENFVQSYFRQFPGVRQYLDETRRLAAQQGYVETLLGRRRYFPNLKNQTNPNIRNREEREAINAPVQGTAADIMKLAMLKVAEAIKKSGTNARLLLQVHDELVLDVPRQEIRETAQLVQSIMESAYQLSIPILTEARSGENWGEMTVIK